MSSNRRGTTAADSQLGFAAAKALLKRLQAGGPPATLIPLLVPAHGGLRCASDRGLIVEGVRTIPSGKPPGAVSPGASAHAASTTMLVFPMPPGPHGDTT